ncbi:ATP-dependent zinc protease, partial [Candidatus Woesearchaeota archaeon]|nr:ATP-dependent zinc protease [Candidatus Woesearchaeota archaeon]
LAKIVLGGKEIESKFTLADRSHMKYPVLIGQNILRKNFLIDPVIRADPQPKEDEVVENRHTEQEGD